MRQNQTFNRTYARIRTHPTTKEPLRIKLRGVGMRIEKIRVEGFRLLQDVEIMLESTSTVIVGRNNSGKTSLTDVFDRFTGENGPRFRLEDFSASLRSKFFDAKALREQKASPEKILAALPKIA